MGSRRAPAVRSRRSRSSSSAGATSWWSWLPGTSTTGLPAVTSPIAREYRRDIVEHRGRRPLAQLEHVAEQDQAVGLLGDRQQPLQRPRMAREVGAGHGAEMQVGHDHRRHGRHLRRRCWRAPSQRGLSCSAACPPSAATTASSPTARSARRARCWRVEGSGRGARRAAPASRASARRPPRRQRSPARTSPVQRAVTPATRSS